MWEAIYETMYNFAGYRMQAYIHQHEQGPVTITLQFFTQSPSGHHFNQHWLGWQATSTHIDQPAPKE